MRKCAILLVLLLVSAVPSSYASGGHILVSDDPNLQTCEIAPAPVVFTLHVIHKNMINVSGSAFMVSLPPCASVVGENVYLPGAIGSFQTGIELDYGGCQSGELVLGEILVFIPDPSPCCVVEPVPHPSGSFPHVAALDCVGSPEYAGGVGVVFKNAGDTACQVYGIEAAHSPDPPDGAMHVATNAQLSWGVPVSWNPCAVLAYPINVINFGTDPGNLTMLGFDQGQPFDPGPLAPGTTYYWQVNYIFGEGSTGPIWSFNTVLPVPTRTTTWGKVKALYR